MNFGRIIAIARKQFRTLRHDKRSLALMLLAPVMAMLIFGFAFGSEPKHIKVVIVNQDAGPLATTIINDLNHETLNISYATDEDTAKQEVQNGNQVAAIIFPENFSSAAMAPAISLYNPSATNYPITRPISPTNAPITLFLDTTNQALAAAVAPAVGNAISTVAKTKGAASPITVTTDYAFPQAKDARYIDYFVPGVMAFAITLFTTLLTLLAFVGERTTGTLDRLRTTPVTETEIVLGYELAFGTIAAIQGFLILIVAILVYHILVVGPVVAAALVVILLAIDAQAIGILISAAARREGQAVQFLPFIVFPIFLLSGVFIPIQSLPDWLRPFSYLLPPTWGIEALRDVLLRGWSFDRIWLPLTILLVFAVVSTILAVLGLRQSRR